MKVLIACEESQTVCKAFRALGCEAYSCDILPCSGGHPEWHLQQNVLPLLKKHWDLIIAHPPCTYMSAAGARWMYPHAGQLSEERYKKAKKAKAFFMEIYNSNCKHIAIENPLPLKVVGLPEPTQVLQPYEFGEPYSKKTLLWLKGLPLLTHTKVIKEHTPYIPSNTSAFSKGSGGSYGVAHDARKRSKTFQGIANAMAQQWTDYLNKINL